MTNEERKAYEKMMGKDFFNTEIGKEFMDWFDENELSLDDEWDVAANKLDKAIEKKLEKEGVADVNRASKKSDDFDVDELIKTLESLQKELLDKDEETDELKAEVQKDCRDEYLKGKCLPEAIVDLLEGCIHGGNQKAPTYCMAVVCHGNELIVMDSDSAKEYKITNHKEPLANLIANIADFLNSVSC